MLREDDPNAPVDSVMFLSRMEETANAVLRILRSTAEGLDVSAEDLDVITGSLNRYRGAIRRAGWTGEYWRYERQHRQMDYDLAELLLDYLNTGITCHAVCQREGCGNIMTTGRGLKKFCSADCRKEHWSYKNQKKYYLEKQKESLANEERNGRNRKHKKSPKRGDDEG